MSTTAARFALVCAIVGFGAATAAAYVHYHILADPTYTSFCDVSATVSCTEAYTSRYGSFAGIPVAIFGAIWFAFAGLLSVAGLSARPAVRESVPGYLFAGSTIGLAVILYLGYASFMLLNVVCVLCLITYAAVIGLFLVSGAATSVPMLSLPRRLFQDLKALAASPLAITLAVLFVGASATTLAFFPREVSVTAGDPVPVATQDQRTELERFMSSAPRVPLAIPRDGAKVLIVKFNDFQCPACSQSYLAYKPVLAKYEASHPGQVKVVLKDYPLSMQCNDTMRTTLHGAACQAAVAVRLARNHNREEAMEEWLYTHQQGMTPETVKQAAREVGQVTDFDEKYEQTIALVKGDIALGQTLRVAQTPTFFINGVKVEGAWAPQFFDQAIAFELNRAQ
jgi:uncharacterized membrane protein/predicted DsbA family dithiol-disulfide isomerase